MSATRRIPTRRAAALAATLGLAGLGTLGLTACSSSATNNFSANTVVTTQPSGEFSGTVPSALASLQSAGKSAAASASASNAARASAFASSVAAESARTQAAYQAALASATGRGNAVSSVSLTGIPKAQTGGLHAAVVTITNRSGATASYAVRVDWTDTSGHVVDSDVVGTEHLAPGAQATPVAFTTKDADLTLIPVVGRAQRY